MNSPQNASRKTTLFRVVVLLLLVVLIGAVSVFSFPYYVQYRSQQMLSAVGEHSREITAVEVLRIDGGAKSGAEGSYFLTYDHTKYAITARHRLTGSQAAELVDLWRNLRFIDSIHAGCHAPDKVLRFLVGSRCVFEVAVCFHCENISYEAAPFTAACISMATAQFDPKEGMGHLKGYLEKLP